MPPLPRRARYVDERQLRREARDIERALHGGRAGDDREPGAVPGRPCAGVDGEMEAGRVAERGPAQVEDQGIGAGGDGLVQRLLQVLDGGDVDLTDRAEAHAAPLMDDVDTELDGRAD